MFCTVINDCLDANAWGRQGSRIAALLGVTPTLVGVGGVLQVDNELDAAELQAAGCLVDVLDASDGAPGLVLVNVANRHAKGKRWPNGTPFGYFWYGQTLVVTSVDGAVLSLARRLGLVERIAVLDVGQVMEKLGSEGVVSEQVVKHVATTQFRSFDFVPRVGAYLTKGGELPNEQFELASADFMVDLANRVWFVDNFGNVKTTILPEEVGFEPGKTVLTRYGELNCYAQLKDVPDGETALIVGSSGILDRRWVELVVQGKSAANVYNISVGSRIT